MFYVIKNELDSKYDVDTFKHKIFSLKIDYGKKHYIIKYNTLLYNRFKKIAKILKKEEDLRIVEFIEYCRSIEVYPVFAEEEITNILIEELAKQIDKEILSNILAMGKSNSK